MTALRSLVEHHDVTWIASAMSDEDREVVDEADGGPIDETARGGAAYRLRLVAHDPTAYDWYYNVIANPMLWFIQHYLWGLASAPDVDHGLHHAWSEGYVAVNRGFADAVVEELDREPDAAVFFHDYHLYVAPALVRERVPDALMAHFIHVPWPMPDYWRVLPESIRRAVHEGVLANDVVSFHTPRWRYSFLRSCVDILGIEPDRTTFEIPLDGPRRPAPREADLGRCGRVRRACGQRGRPGRRGDDRGRPTRVSHPPRRPNRSRRRTSFGASAPTSSISTRIRRCTSVFRCSRCSTLRGRTSPSTPSTWARSSVPPGS